MIPLVSRRRGVPLALLVTLALVGVTADSASAVIIQTLTGTDNTTPPADDPGFANVGMSLNGVGTAIYLGEGWVLTANHVGGGGIVLGSGTYLQATGSNTAFALVNNTPGKTTFTDLYMYKLATQPVGLPTLAIASATPPFDAAVLMVGGGRDRGDYTQWLVDQTVFPWQWSVTGSNGNFAGYPTAASRSVRWGTNTIAYRDVWATDGLDVKSLATIFDPAPGTSEAQAVVNDSGGAVFTKVDGQWQLAGVIFAVGGYPGQPSPVFTAVLGNVTWMADLAFYRPQIVAVVPEPSSAVLVMGAAAMAAWPLARRRRRRT